LNLRFVSSRMNGRGIPTDPAGAAAAHGRRDAGASVRHRESVQNGSSRDRLADNHSANTGLAGVRSLLRAIIRLAQATTPATTLPAASTLRQRRPGACQRRGELSRTGGGLDAGRLHVSAAGCTRKVQPGEAPGRTVMSRTPGMDTDSNSSSTSSAPFRAERCQARRCLSCRRASPRPSRASLVRSGFVHVDGVGTLVPPAIAGPNKLVSRFVGGR
jgi:hypothetical protein